MADVTTPLSVKLDDTQFRKAVMESLGVEPEQEFYLKVYKEKTTQQYGKLPKEGYVGIRDFDMGVCFLVRFKFLKDTYEFSSDCKYMLADDYEKAFTGLLTGVYVAVGKISLKNRFYIQLIDHISIEQIESEYLDEDETEDDDTDNG